MIIETQMINPLSSDRLLSLFGFFLTLHLISLMASIAVAQITVGILVVLAILMLLSGLRYTRTILDVSILVFISARILSIIFSEYAAISVESLHREIAFYTSFFAIVLYLQNVDREKENSHFQWLFVSSAIVCAIAIVKVVAGIDNRANGLSGGGTLASHLSMVILAAVIYRDKIELFRSRLYFLTLMVILTAGLLFTTKRGDWIATLAAVLLYGFVFSRKLALALVVMVVGVTFAITPFRERLLTLTHPLENSSDRIALWENATMHAKEHPFLGFGPRTFPVVFTARERIGDKGIGSWHNDFIEIYMESGLVGITAFLIYLVSIFVCCIKLIRTKHPTKLLCGWMGLLILIAYLIIGLFGSLTLSITNAMLFRFFIAVISVEQLRKPPP
jgi:O-antigen ligase